MPRGLVPAVVEPAAFFGASLLGDEVTFSDDVHLFSAMLVFAN